MFVCFRCWLPLSLSLCRRLSTIRNANKIIVLDKGSIVEQGSHEELIAKHGAYFKLVQRQLEGGGGGSSNDLQTSS